MTSWKCTAVSDHASGWGRRAGAPTPRRSRERATQCMPARRFSFPLRCRGSPFRVQLPCPYSWREHQLWRHLFGQPADGGGRFFRKLLWIARLFLRPPSPVSHCLNPHFSQDSLTIAGHWQTNFVGSNRRCHSYAGISLKPDLLWWGVCPGSERRLLIIRSPLRSAKAVWGRFIRRRTRSRPLAVWRAGRIFGSV
jgi:hypothetical protein